MARRRLVASASVLVAYVLAGDVARANPPDTYGFGSRETAMGGAAAAETRGFAAGYYNPAALARSRGLEVGVGYFYAGHALEMNGRDSNVDAVRGFNGGLVAPGRLLGIPFAFGIALHLPDRRISRVRALRQEQPRWELYDNRNQRLVFAANLALEPFPWLWIGGGLSFMSSTRGSLDIGGGANIFRPDESQIRHEVDADLTAVRYPQAGVRVALSDRIALAAVYRGEFRLVLDLQAHIFGDISSLTTALYQLHTYSINNFLPQQAVIGGSWALSSRLKATFDATWVNWSAYVAPVPRLDVLLEVPPPASGWPATISPPVPPAATRVEPLKMYDRIVPRMGLEWHALGMGTAKGFVRAGYEVARSPFEAQRLLTSYVDRDRHAFSFGLGASFEDPFEALPGTLTVDAHVQLTELVAATTRKANAADLVGDFTAGGRIVNVGLTMGVQFDGPDRDKEKKGGPR